MLNPGDISGFKYHGQLVNRVFRIFRLATPKFLYQKYGRTQFELFCCILCIQNIVIYCQTQGYLLIEMSTWDVYNSEILIRTHCTQKILTVGFKCTKIYIYRTGYKNHSFDDSPYLFRLYNDKHKSNL